jgi:hypothetical protein
MSHPFESISSNRLQTAFWLFTATTALLLIVDGTIYVRLTNPVATLGILSLELASTPDRLSQVVNSWAEGPKSGMIFSLGLNSLCLLTLTNAIAAACTIVEKHQSGLLSSLGPLLAWAQWLAAVIWAVQNSLMAWGVLVHPTPFTTALSASLAIAKFTLVGAGILYAIIGSLLWLAGSRPITARQDERS